MFSSDSTYLALVGPTCVGKTLYSHALLTEFPFELINVDSFQVYSFFRLGTGRADLQTQRAHLYGFQRPDVVLTPEDYLTRVERAIELVNANDHVPLFEGGSISYLKALLSRYRLRLIGLRPRDTAHAGELIEQRMTADSENLLLTEIATGLRQGYENTIILQDDVVYLPYVKYLDGKLTLDETRERVRDNLLRRYHTQMKEYETLEVEWFEPSIESLDLIRDLVARFLAVTPLLNKAFHSFAPVSKSNQED